VGHGVSGFLVNGHDPRDYASVLGRLADEPLLLDRFGEGAVRHARVFGWDATAERLLGVYKSAVSDRVCA
jgi:D-inositol-3-phosphate glycosyltransferase